MEITEIRIKLMEDNHERLQAFCSVTFDDMFVIRDLKIIEGTKGSFVAMPSRKLTDRCNRCGCKNHLRARHCNNCGGQLNENRAARDPDGRIKLHADVAHPINSSCREFIQGAVIRAFNEELEKAKQPGYICRYDQFDAGDYEEDSYEQVIGSLHGPESRTNGSYRQHTAHEPQGTHTPTFADEQEPAVVGEASSEAEEQQSFGAGIL